MNIHIDMNIFNQSHIPFIEDSTHKFLILLGGSGSGKSYAVAQKLLIKALQSKRRILCIRKTKTSQKDSCFKLFKELISKWNISSLCSINKTDFTITFVNGSEILFYGCDDSERLKSLVDLTDGWCEEATELTEDDYDQIVLRIRANVPNIQIIASFNPVSKANWVYKRWFQDGAVIEPDTAIFKSTYKDNRFLPDSYIKSLENMIKTNPIMYRIYSLGEFCSLDRLVFNNWSVQSFTLDSVKNFKHIVGMDFGFVSDPSTIVDSFVDAGNKILYIYRTYGSTGKTNDELAKILIDLGLSKSEIVADSAEPKSISELKRAGITRIHQSKKGPDSIRYGIQKLQQYKIVVNNVGCDGIITEFENYSWKKDNKTGEYLNEPIDSFNHYIDGLRYSIQLINNQQITFDKKLLGV